MIYDAESAVATVDWATASVDGEAAIDIDA